MIKFIHVQKNNLFNMDIYTNGTIALVLPSKVDLTNLFLEHGSQTLVKIGVSILNPNDMFCKKTGREISSSRLNFAVAHLNDIRIQGTKHIYDFYVNIPDFRNDERQIRINLGVSTIKESHNVKIIYGTFGE